MLNLSYVLIGGGSTSPFADLEQPAAGCGQRTVDLFDEGLPGVNVTIERSFGQQGVRRDWAWSLWPAGCGP